MATYKAKRLTWLVSLLGCLVFTYFLLMGFIAFRIGSTPREQHSLPTYAQQINREYQSWPVVRGWEESPIIVPKRQEDVSYEIGWNLDRKLSEEQTKSLSELTPSNIRLQDYRGPDACKNVTRKTTIAGGNIPIV